MLALEAGETLQVIDVLLRLHDHVARGDRLFAVRTVSGRSEQPANTYTESHTLKTLRL